MEQSPEIAAMEIDVTPLESAVVQICHHRKGQWSQHEVEGTGFILNQSGLVSTCAHVVDAISPDADGWYVIGFVAEKIITYGRAKKLESNTISRSYDVAYLQIEVLPQSAKILPLGTARNSAGKNFLSRGFPNSGPVNALFADGKVLRRVFTSTSELFQLDSKIISRGFSGAPVWDEKRQCVIGMVSAILRSDTDGKRNAVAFMIPSDVLQALHPALKLVDINPYVGLTSYTEATSLYYYGRNPEIGRLLNGMVGEPLLEPARFILLSGPSGSGKSSLVSAGVLPAIKLIKAWPQIKDQWAAVSMRPGSDPIAQLAQIGLDINLVASARQHLANHPSKARRLLFVVDQAEELFTDCPATEREKFCDALRNLIIETGCAATVLVVVRDDFRSKIIDAIKRPALDIRLSVTINAEALRTIISQPAIDVQNPFPENFITTILQDSLDLQTSDNGTLDNGRTAILPLLEFTLSEIWRRRNEGNTPLDIYSDIGRIGGSLSRWAEDQYGQLEPKQQEVMKRTILDLIYLIPVDDRLTITRKVTSYDDLTVSQDAELKLIAPFVIRRMIAAHLLVSYTDQRRNVEVIDIIHEQLLSRWARIAEWIKEHRSVLLNRQEISRRAEAWERNLHGQDYLLRGNDLEEARALLKMNADWIRDDDNEFIHASIGGAKHTKFKQKTSVVGVIFICLLVYCAFAYNEPLPGSHEVQVLVDTFYPFYSDQEIANEASRLQARLTESLSVEGWSSSHQGNRCDNLKPWHYRNEENDTCNISVWDASDAMLGLAISNNLDKTKLDAVIMPNLKEIFKPSIRIDLNSHHYGWRTSRPAGNDLKIISIHDPWGGNDQRVSIAGGVLKPFADADPALLLATMLSTLLANHAGQINKSDQHVIIDQLHYAQIVADEYRLSPTSPTWDLFINQKRPQDYNAYATTAALWAALESRAACITWANKQDPSSIVQTIVDHFSREPFTQWHQAYNSNNISHPEALDYQIAAELLLAEPIADIQPNSNVISAIPNLLEEAYNYNIQSVSDFPNFNGEDSNEWSFTYNGQQRTETEDVVYAWYPWATATAALWYRYTLDHHLGHALVNRARLYLGHFIVNLGEKAATNTLDSRTWEKGEMLFGISIAERLGRFPMNHNCSMIVSNSKTSI